MREIVTNCGEEPSVVLNKVKEGKGSYGYNAATGEYGDMIAMGILDPTKVTRTSLRGFVFQIHFSVQVLSRGLDRMSTPLFILQG